MVDSRIAIVLHRSGSELFGIPLVFRFLETASCLEVRRGVYRLLNLLRAGTDRFSEADIPEEELSRLPLCWTDYEGENQSIDSEKDLTEKDMEGEDYIFPSDTSPISSSKHAGVRNTEFVFLACDWDNTEKLPEGWKYEETLSFGIKNDVSAMDQLAKLRKQQKIHKKLGADTFTLHDCLKFFSNVERLGSGNSWSCPKCKKAQQAYKMMNIIRLPEILILTLKRFEHRGFSGGGGKIGAVVDFPLENLDMASYLAEFGGDLEKEDTIFDLFAVTNHYGRLGYGHYTAYVARQFGSDEPVRWFECDDSRITEVPKDRILSSSAYVLYYKRRRPSNSSKLA